MPDVYAVITEVDEAVVDQVADAFGHVAYASITARKPQPQLGS